MAETLQNPLMATSPLNLDLLKEKPFEPYPLNLNQGDKGYMLPFSLSSGFAAYTVDALHIGFWGAKPDENVVDVKGERITAKDDYWLFAAPDELSQAAGTVENCYFYVFNDEGTIMASTSRFSITVSQKWGDEIASNSYITQLAGLSDQIADGIAAAQQSQNYTDQLNKDAAKAISDSQTSLTKQMTDWTAKTQTNLTAALKAKQDALDKLNADETASYKAVTDYYAKMQADWTAKLAEVDKAASDQRTSIDADYKKQLAAALADIKSQADTQRTTIQTAADAAIKTITDTNTAMQTALAQFATDKTAAIAQLKADGKTASDAAIKAIQDDWATASAALKKSLTDQMATIQAAMDKAAKTDIPAMQASLTAIQKSIDEVNANASLAITSVKTADGTALPFSAGAVTLPDFATKSDLASAGDIKMADTANWQKQKITADDGSVAVEIAAADDANAKIKPLMGVYSALISYQNKVNNSSQTLRGFLVKSNADSGFFLGVEQTGAVWQAQIKGNAFLSFVRLANQSEIPAAPDLSPYMKTATADGKYQPKGDFVTNAVLTGKGYQTAAQVTTAITAKGYQTASQVAAAIAADDAAVWDGASGIVFDSGTGASDSLLHIQLEA